MWEEIVKAIPIYLLSMLKVVFGPIGGYMAKLHMFTSMFVTFAGMMTTVTILTFFGDLLKKGMMKRWFERQQAKAMTSKWGKYGLFGIAFLTPLLLTPIGGSVLAVAGGYPRSKIMVYMLVSGALYAVAFTWATYYFGQSMIDLLGRFAPTTK
jgi:membrane protein YqaA with SNARE-associated domain